MLDTNLVSALIEPRTRVRAPVAIARLEERVRSEGLTIAAVTLFELRRGVRALVASGAGHTKAARLEKVLRSAYVLGLDDRDFSGWDVAADLWARARAHGLTLAEGDLLIAATALHHGRTLLTADEHLVQALAKLGHVDLATTILLGG